MECGDAQKTLLQVLAENLYVSNGVVYLNVTTSKVDCETITPLIACGDFIDPDALLSAHISASDACGNPAVNILLASGQDTQNIRTVTEAGNMLMSDEVIVLDTPIAIDFYLLAASGSGRERHIKNIGVGDVTVSAGLGTLDGVTEVILNQWESLHVIDYADNTWLIL